VHDTCARNNIAKKHVWLLIETYKLGFSRTLLAINQNVDSQLCMDVKTHHLHMNYLKLDYLFFLIKFVSNKMLFAKSTPQMF